MLELLKVLVGIATVATVAMAGYEIYKIIDRKSAKDEINRKIEEKDFFQEAFKAKVKEKGNTYISATVLDKWDMPLGEVEVTGDEVSDDIQVGDEIILTDADWNDEIISPSILDDMDAVSVLDCIDDVSVWDDTDDFSDLK
jgi:hypothetical protein